MSSNGPYQIPQFCSRCILTATTALKSLKYRSNALEGIFYDVPANENDGSGSFCGVEITR